jgi:eukaryotic-like serine/threonine-protein kinase
MRQVAAALHKAGQHKIVHRDIKPENIMLAKTGEVKVADFGLARVTAGNGEATDLTQIGITMGTPLYMSPEQVEGGLIDPRSDIYSFGVTCYQMFAGRTPFEGETALSIAVQHLKSEPQRLEHARPDLPAGLCRIVHKMLAKKPEERYERAADLLRDLRSLALEGPDEWPDGDEWGSAEMLALADVRAAATQQLDAVMKSQAMQIQRRSRGWMLLVLLAPAAFVIGAAIAWANRPQPLLDVPPDAGPVIERMETAQQQYLFALFTPADLHDDAWKEEAWMSVERYFPQDGSPQNQRYARLAKQRLGELYLRTDDLDRALEVYTELANLEPTEEQFRAYGMAGLLLVYQRQRDVQQVTRLLPRVMTSRQHLDPELRGQVEEIARNYGSGGN